MYSINSILIVKKKKYEMLNLSFSLNNNMCSAKMIVSVRAAVNFRSYVHNK